MQPWATDEGLFALVELLRTYKGGFPSYIGRENDKAVEFFGGGELVEFLLRADGNARIQFPQLTTQDKAYAVGRALLQRKFMHRSLLDVQYLTMLEPFADEADGSAEFVSYGVYVWDYEIKGQKRNVKKVPHRSFLICAVM